MSNVMAALPNIGGAVWLTPTTRVSCSSAAKTRNPLKLAGVHVGEVLLFNKFFSDCRYVP